MKEGTLETLSTPIPTHVVSCTPGRIRLRVSQPHAQATAIKRIANVLEADPKINQVRTNIQTGSLTVMLDNQTASVDNIFASLRDLGIIFIDVTKGKSKAAAEVTHAAFDLNKQVERATNGVVDLRFLFPLGLGTLAVRQLLTKGLQFEVIPWYVLAWYSFDSFIKLHYTSEPQSKTK
jgi:hypothetical protein